MDQYEYEFDLVNPKYQSDCNDAVQLLENNDYRVIQLATVAKLTTDNRSMLSDFPIKEKAVGANPLNKFCIRVADTYGAELNILVHQKDGYALLLPIATGFAIDNITDCVKLTENWRFRNLSQRIYVPDGVNTLEGTMIDGVFTDNKYADIIVSNDFGSKTYVIKVSTKGIFGENRLLNKPVNDTVYNVWYKSQMLSLYDEHYRATCPSSAALVLQIYLHTLALWHDASLNREIVVHEDKSDYSLTYSEMKTHNFSHRHIININHKIHIYVDSSKSKREFRGFHMLQTDRCGHFRHYTNGKVVYIPPTVVHFKKVLPDASLSIMKPIVYRNTDDFLREKSYLEDDLFRVFRQRGIKFEREKMFKWLGRKRLDFFLPELNVAIECQGVQHFYKYGANDKDLDNRKQRDKDKYAECVANNVTLLYYMNDAITLPDDTENKDLYFTNIDELLSYIGKGVDGIKQ